MYTQPLNIPQTDRVAQPFERAYQTHRAEGAGFAGELKAAEQAPADGAKEEKLKTLRKSAEQLVATTFVMPLLAQMRNDPFKTDLFHGGQAEEMFGQQLDTVFAERIVAKSNFSIVDAVYRKVAQSASLLAEQGQGVDANG